MAVQSHNQQPIRSHSDKITNAPDAETASLNLCGNALAFAQAVHFAYTTDVAIASNSWDRPVLNGDADARAQAKDSQQHRDESVICG